MKRSRLPLSYQVGHPDIDRNGWIRISWARHSAHPTAFVPDVCCCCLAPTKRRHLIPGEPRPISFGLCEDCAARWRKRQHRCALIIALGALGVSCIAALVLRLYFGASWTLTAWVSSVALAGVIYIGLEVIVARFSEPVQISTPLLGDRRFRFRNPAYRYIFLQLPVPNDCETGTEKPTGGEAVPRADTLTER